ncbi:hypothetical protein DTO195F2_2723 [Paecilomyces variotii]|nr:hypothetical protein DTO195F2_2723 [Paecilomyces variotii]
MPGVAALAVSSSSTASPASNSSNSISNSSSNSSHCNTSNYSSRGTAIGAGVGVPLGVIAVASIAWAFWERRSRLKAVSQRSEMEVQGLSGFGGHFFTDSVAPAELAHNPVSELCSQKGHDTRNYS